VTARDVGRAYGASRVALGAGLLVAPRLLGRPWIGRPATLPPAQVALRALGARDLIMGLITLHTLDHPEVGPRWQRTCAATDAVDALATLGARRSLPRGATLVAALAAAGSATGLAVAGGLERSA
jgi:hypothetical protein